MRRLLIAGMLAIAAAIPVSPAQAGVGACVVAAGFPACAGTCSPGDTLTVIAVGTSGESGTVSCGGNGTTCYAFKLPCTGSTSTSGSGALRCSGSAPVVICLNLGTAR